MSSSTILVVDDNPTNLKLVSDLLEFEGYRILRAVDAETAQEIIRSDLPDMILMDVGLPKMDGLSLTRLLKSDEHTRDVIIVALTAFAMKEDETRAKEAGCDGYLATPIDTRLFPKQVASYLTRSGGFGQGPL